MSHQRFAFPHTVERAITATAGSPSITMRSYPCGSSGNTIVRHIDLEWPAVERVRRPSVKDQANYFPVAAEPFIPRDPVALAAPFFGAGGGRAPSSILFTSP